MAPRPLLINLAVDTGVSQCFHISAVRVSVKMLHTYYFWAKTTKYDELLDPTAATVWGWDETL